MASSSSALNTDLLDLFDCPICMNFMYPPIYQCRNGHYLCRECKEKMNNKCPTCKTDIGDIRALALEKVGDTITFPCKYRENGGCLGSFKYDLKQKHEEECDRRPYKCPFQCGDQRCAAVGDVKKLVTHLTDDHHVRVERRARIDMSNRISGWYLNVPSSHDIVIHEWLSQHFILQWVTSKEKDMSCVYLSFMGEQSEADNYLCALEMGDEHGEYGKMIWQGIPRSIRKEFDCNYGLALRHSVAHRLIPYGFLSRDITGCIWRK